MKDDAKIIIAIKDYLVQYPKLKKRVKTLYLVTKDDRYCCFIVPECGSFDFDLADMLTKFIQSLHKHGLQMAHQVPEDSLGRFFDQEKAKVIYDQENEK